MNAIVTRHATASDLPQLADLRWRLQTDDAQSFSEQDKAMFVASFIAARVQRDSNTFHFVAENGGRIVGAMTVRKVEKIPSPRELVAFWGYLTNCYVRTEFRDKFVGSTLLDFVTRWAKEENLEMLVVWPSDKSYPFYERKGFRREPDPLVLKLTEE